MEAVEERDEIRRQKKGTLDRDEKGKRLLQKEKGKRMREEDKTRKG